MSLCRHLLICITFQTVYIPPPIDDVSKDEESDSQTVPDRESSDAENDDNEDSDELEVQSQSILTTYSTIL